MRMTIISFFWLLRIGTLLVLTVFMLMNAKLQVTLLRLATSEQIKQARGALLITSLFLLGSTILISADFGYFSKPYWNMVINMGLLGFIILQAVSLFRAAKLLWRPSSKIIADYCATVSNEHLQMNSDAEALKAICKACELDPDEPLHWLRRSLIEREYGQAENCIEIAENLMTEQGTQSAKLCAWLERSKGILLLEDASKTELALEYFKKSLTLDYNENTIALIRKAEELIQSKKALNDR